MAWVVNSVTRRRGCYKVRLVNEAIGKTFVATKRDSQTNAEFLTKTKAELAEIAATVVPQAIIDQLDAVDFNS